jgi:hypothetical protein
LAPNRSDFGDNNPFTTIDLWRMSFLPFQGPLAMREQRLPELVVGKEVEVTLAPFA